MDNYICKIANIDEMNTKWDYEIDNATLHKNNWITWKKEYINNFQKGYIIPYYGLLNGVIIVECTAAINPLAVQKSQGLVDENTAYLYAFRTIKEYQGKGYFSILFKYMLQDLKNRGYQKVTIGVEPSDQKNKEIYFHYGFTEYIKQEQHIYPDGKKIDVEFYQRKL